jgi:putative phage-type endonuclease
MSIDYVDSIKNILHNLTNNGEYIDYNDKEALIDEVYSTFNNFYNDYDVNLVDNICNKLLTKVYLIDNTRNILIKKDKKKINIPEEYKSLVKHLEYLDTIPQTIQKSDAWFAQRREKITASSAAKALGELPKRYSNSKPEYLILEKLDIGPPFPENDFVHHGKKYEEIATKIYENIYNVQIKEYGLMPHPEISYLGASPDGIITKYTLNNDFTNMIGTMLEIKCPFRRKIKTSGNDICPSYYHTQVLQQLECCDLEKCDFWQCELIEYKSRREWLLDTNPNTQNTEQQNLKKEMPYNCQKGCIIQLTPKRDLMNYSKYKSAYLYPLNIDMTPQEYDDWVLNILSNYKNLDEDDFEDYNIKITDEKYIKDYVYDEVNYWKLVKSHNLTINRDKKWFEEKKPIYKAFWDRVLYYRNNMKEALLLKKKLEDTNYNKNNKKISKKIDITSTDLFLSSDEEDTETNKNNNQDLFVESSDENSDENSDESSDESSDEDTNKFDDNESDKYNLITNSSTTSEDSD